MDTIVSLAIFLKKEPVFTSADDACTCSGETLEKATRVLSDEERALMNQEFIGKNGEKRRIEVRRLVNFQAQSLEPRDAFCCCRICSSSWVAKS
jgi:hypothetical protein